MSRQAVFSSQPEPPVARRADHGDPYAWMRDSNWMEVLGDPSRLDPVIAAHLTSENAYTDQIVSKPLAALRARLFEEMTSRLDPEEKSVPVLDGPYAYYHRHAPGMEYRIYARTDRARAFDPAPPETVLVDGNALATDGYFSFGQVRHSPDHARVAYTTDTSGSEYHTVTVCDLADDRRIDTGITDAAGDIAWGADSCLYWVRRNAHGRPDQVWLWRDNGPSLCVYAEKNQGFFVSLEKTRCGSFVIIRSADHTTSESHLLAVADPDPRPEIFIARRTGVEYDLETCGDRFVIRTNADGAADFKLVMRDREGVSTDLVPHRAGCLIEDFAVFARHLVRLERHNARLAVVIRDMTDHTEHVVALGSEALDVHIDPGFEQDTDQVRLQYSSPISPRAVADYDMTGHTRLVRKPATTHWNHDPSGYVTERLDATAKDGAEIPVTVTRRHDTPLDGSAPVLLYGYGGYGITVADSFRSDVISLLDRGFVYANAHVRGSMARGYQWYQDGKLTNKPNSFSDFVAVGRYLVATGYTSAGKIVALGRSAGGLLVGAAVNLDPELFAAVIAGVPFVDVLNTMSDPDLPLTPPEWPEWGNPISSDADRALIASYCPYRNVTGRNYPPILATGSVSDPRVGYWEPAKWIATLRHRAPDGGPCFLLMNMSAGHGGQSGRYRRLEETATEYAFALAAVGWAET